MKTQAVILPEAGQSLIVDEIEIPDPGEGELLVRNLASGVCHSQFHQMRATQPHGRPLLLGHEATSEVVAVGPGVTHVQPGQRVLLTWHRRDAQPGDGPAAPVPAARWRGQPVADEFDGIYTWSGHSLVRQEYVVPIPDDLPADIASVVGCAVMTESGAVINTADVPAGRSAVLIGAGGVGLSAIAALAVRGAAPIIAVDLEDAKLDFARRFGATDGVNARENDATDRVRELTAGGVDYAFDCIGHAATIAQALAMARPGDWTVTRGGLAVVVGWPIGEVAIDALDLVIGEKQLAGSAGGSARPERDFPVFLQWYRDGQLDLDALVTERWSLDQIGEATDRLAAGRVSGRSVFA